MKKIILFLTVATLMSFTVAYQQLTEAERNFAVQEMTTSKEMLLEATKGLSEAQLNFKADALSWSIAECTEHIAIAESNLLSMVTKALESEADPSRRGEVQVTDEQILEVIVDRSNKFKAPEAFQPSGKFGSFGETLEEFLTKREDNIAFIKNTQEDLRNHYAQTPMGTLDAYQVLLFMSAHSERHILQIKEVMAHEDFPKQ